DDAYGLMSIDGEPTPACLAKQLFAQHVQYGDCVRFPMRRAPNIDSVISRNDKGRRSAVFVNTTGNACSLTVADWAGGLDDCIQTLRLDGSTGGRIARGPFTG